MQINRKLAAGLGLGAPVLAIVAMTLLSLFAPDYDPLQRAVYELAMVEVTGAANIMRFAGYMGAGVLVLPLSVGLYQRASTNGLVRVGSVLLALSGIAWALLGIFPAQFGNEEMMVMNGLIALVFALTGGSALVLFSLGLPWRPLWRILVGLSGLLVYASVLATSPTLPLPGLLERICFYTYFIWAGVLAVWLWSEGNRSQSQHKSI